MRPFCATSLACAIALEASAIVLPGGFASDLVASGFDRPVQAVFTPDGRLLVVEKAGSLWLVKGSTKTRILDLRGEVNGQSDRGLLSVAVHPSFAQNGWIYLLYMVDPVAGDPDESAQQATWGRLTRYTMSGDSVVGSSRTVLLGATAASGIPSCFSSHSIGTVRFGLDGTLFVGAGDGGHWDFADGGENVTALDHTCEDTFGAGQDLGAWRAQSLDSLAGKILRIDAGTGRGLATNPFWTGDADAARSKVFARGLRNPFRFTVKPGSPAPGTLFVGDVGWAQREEIDVVRGGENLGWPCWEGTLQPAEYLAHPVVGPKCAALAASSVTPPLLSLSHSTDKATSGAFFYAGSSWPAEYRGAFLYADYVKDTIVLVQVDGANSLISKQSFATDVGTPVSLEPEPGSGDLVYVALLPGEVRRIRYTLVNQAPAVVISADPTAGSAPLRVAFSSNGTLDREGDAFTLDWDFGDGSAHSGAANPVHDYLQTGAFTARLTATDARGASASRSIVITTQNRPPSIAIDSPVDGLRFEDHDQLVLRATASDPEDGTNLSWLWEIDLVHAEHVHPQEFVSTLAQPPTFVLHAHGETGERYLYRVKVTVTDAQGEKASAFANVVPAGLANAPPVAAFTAAPTSGAAPIAVIFDAAATIDPDGDLVTYAWDFGDGASATGSRTSHIYDRPGRWTAALTASDLFGASSRATQTIDVGGAPAPAAAWTFDEATGTVVHDAIGDANGTVFEARWTPGRSGTALAFDGANDFVRIPTTPSVTPAGALTIAAWVRLADPNRASYMRIVSKKAKWDATSGFALSYHPGKNLLELHGSGADYARATIDLDTGWHHLAATANGAAAVLYVDGVALGGDRTITRVVAGSTDLVLGREAGGGNTFAGAIDDVSIWPIALDPSAVALVATNDLSSNRQPEAAGASVSTTSGTPVDLVLAASDPDGDVLTFAITTGPAHGSLSGTPPRLTYTPAPGFVGDDAFTFAVSDEHGGSDSARIDLAVTAGASDAGLAGWWRFEEGSGTSTRDETGDGGNGTLLSGPSWIAGRAGSALSFDGVDDRVVTSPSPRLAASGAVTVAAWVRLADPAKSAYLRIASKKSRWDAGSGYALSYNPAKRLLEILGSGTKSGRATGVALDGQWHHLAGVIDGASARLYVDGVERTTDPTVTPLAAGTTPLVIGSEAGGSGRFLGTIDELRVYDRALADDEIAALAAAP